MERSYQALQVGRVWWEQGSFEQALHAWKNALRCAYEEQNIPVMYVVCKNLGMICMDETQQLDDALEYFHYAKEIVAKCDLEDILHRYAALEDSLYRIEKKIIKLKAKKQIDKSPQTACQTPATVCCATCGINSKNVALVFDENDGEMYCQKCYDEYYAQEDYEEYQDEELVMDDNEDEMVHEDEDTTDKEEEEVVDIEESNEEEEEDLPFKLIVDLPANERPIPIETTKAIVKNYSLSYLLSFQDQCTECPEELKSSLVHQSNAKTLKTQHTNTSLSTTGTIPQNLTKQEISRIMSNKKAKKSDLISFFPSQETVEKMRLEYPMEQEEQDKMSLLLFSSLTTKI